MKHGKRAGADTHVERWTTVSFNHGIFSNQPTSLGSPTDRRLL